MSALPRKPTAADDPLPAMLEPELDEEDGEPMESTWHRDQMVLLIEQIRHHWRRRRDYFVGGNMFIYFDIKQTLPNGKKRKFRGPDFFVAKGVQYNPLRPIYVVWREEGRYPHFILELLSKKTKKTDRTIKKEVYQSIFRTPEYLLYDPDKEKLEGFRLVDMVYEPMEPDARGWLWCEELQLWIGKWQGAYQGCDAVWIRFYDAHGAVVPLSSEESQALLAAERRQKEDALKSVEAERKRAEAAEAELARWKRGPKRTGRE